MQQKIVLRNLGSFATRGTGTIWEKSAIVLKTLTHSLAPVDDPPLDELVYAEVVEAEEEGAEEGEDDHDQEPCLGALLNGAGHQDHAQDGQQLKTKEMNENLR